MALRSGYYGLKNSVRRSLEKLASDMSSAKIIKSIGDGLKLTNAGKLSCDIDSDTMTFKSGKLSVKNVAGIKCKIYQGQGGTDTVITLDDTPEAIIAIYELGKHGDGYWGFVSAFGSNACKGLWVTPNNNSIGGANLTYALNENVLTISGGSDASQRADIEGSSYAILYV